MAGLLVCPSGVPVKSAMKARTSDLVAKRHPASSWVGCIIALNASSLWP
jgi:hypothetical protein